jgi:type IV pilus assembly protein PilW
MLPIFPSNRFARARGFSMVELMVAMLIALIGTIVIFQVYEVSEGIKRTTSSGGEAQQNGAIALYTIDDDLRNAGMGFNETALAGCNMVGYDTARSPNNFPTAPATMPMVPVFITAGGSATAPDQFSVFYGSQTRVAGSTNLIANMASATSPLVVANPYGYRTGDILLLAQPGAGTNCALMEVTAISSNQITHNSGTYSLDWVPSGAQTKTARLNPAAGLGITYTGANTVNATRVFNLGNLYDSSGNSAITNEDFPVYNTYAISGNALTRTSGFSSAAAVAVADNIVHMRVVYGLDDGTNNNTITYNAAYTAGDGIIDRFVDGTTTPNWQRVIAVRIALVSRSALPEKPSAGAGQPCDTTPNAPTWSGSAWSALGLQTTFDLSADTNWKCYRYKVFETTIPLRNWIWRSS